MDSYSTFPWTTANPLDAHVFARALVSADGMIVGYIFHEADARWIASMTGRTDQLDAIGERVATVRRRRGWTQQDLADQLGVSRNTISLVECGKNPNPGVQLVRDIAILGDVSMDWLIMGKEGADAE